MTIRYLRRLAGIVVGGVAPALVLAGAYLGLLQVCGNFNTVVSRELYRSAQISPQRLDDYVTKYGIKTVVNLRGGNPGATWYEAETSESQRLHIDHIDFGLSARREVSERQTSELIALLRNARKPILIHCKSGSDRTGLASALYLLAIKKRRPEVAEAQLSIRFGHFSLPFIPEYAMDRSLKRFELSSGTSSAE